MTYPKFLALSLLAAFPLCGAGQNPAPAAATSARASAAAPNILLFLVDDLGQRDLGCYGSTFYETPHIDKLAREGVLFTDAYATSPVCSPSRAAFFTGQWPQRSGVTDYIGAPLLPTDWKRNTKLLPATYRDRLPLENTTIASALRETGYATFFAGKWHLGPEETWPEHHGFDVNRGGTDKGSPYDGRYFSPYGNPRLADGPEGEHLADRLATETIRFIEQNQARAFFACYAFYDVHTPLVARPDLRQKYESKRARLGLKDEWGREGERDVRLTQDHAIYAAMVEGMDQAVGRILARLDELKLSDNTLVIFTSDNGGLSTSEGWPTSNLPLRAGKGWMYEGGIRVPLIIRWPAVANAGVTCATPVSGIDYFPTLLEAGGTAATPARKTDGVSLLPLLKGETTPERSLYWHYPHYGNQGGAPSAAIRRGDWKLIHWLEDDTLELYDVRNDIGEKTDLASAQPGRVAVLRDDLAAWQKSVGASFPTPNPGYNPAKLSGRASKRNP